MESKYSSLEKFKTVQRWLTSVGANGTGSDRSRYMYLMNLKLFCNWAGYDPDQLIADRRAELKIEDEAVKRRAEERLEQYFRHLEKEKGYSRSYCVTAFGTIRSFYKHNYLPLQVETPQKWTIRTLKVPTLEELKRLVDACESLRDKAYILTQAQSGLSRSDMAELTYGLVRDKLDKPPLVVEWTRSKTKTKQCLALGKDACNALKAYLASRRAGTKYIGPEELEDDSPLFLSESSKTKKLMKPFDKKVNEMIARASKKAGLSGITSHCLRKFFSTSMKNAGVNETVVEYLMGHSLGAVRGAYYLPSLDQIKEIYVKAEPYLSVSKVSAPDMDAVKKEMLLAMWREQAKMLGIDPLKVRIEKRRELGREPDVEEEKEALQSEIKKITIQANKPEKNKDDCQRIVSEKELPYMLAAGWRVVTALPSGKIVIED